MLNIDFDNVTVTNANASLPSGWYHCVISETEPELAKSYVRFHFEVAAGEHKGELADKHYLRKSMVFSYKPTALGMLKGRLADITASNPGFDAEAAFNAGDVDGWRAFVGKRVGVAFREEEREWNGEVRVDVNPCFTCPDNAVDGRPAPKRKGLAKKDVYDRPAPVTLTAGADTIDIPF